MLLQENSTLKYEKVVIYLKTISFKHDNRTKREIESLVKIGVSVEVIVFCDDESPVEYEGAKIIQYRGLKKTAPANPALRAAAALCFILYALRLARRAQRASYIKTLHWVADPILFPLVIMLKKLKYGDVLWDHHELPPTWITRGGKLSSLFIRAYNSADIVAHANKSRMQHLESETGAKAKRLAIINNYPKKTDLSSEKTIDSLKEFANEEKFVFLQNSLGDNRCGPSIFLAVKQSGLKIIHAGHVSLHLKAILEAEVGDIDKFCIFTGPLSLSEINWLLRRAFCTIICYKQTSANQIYCEPNRLYQAMGIGARIIAGNNPTMLEEISGYSAGIVLKDDGSNSNGVSTALSDMLSYQQSSSNKASNILYKSWAECEDTIFSIIRQPV